MKSQIRFAAVLLILLGLVYSYSLTIHAKEEAPFDLGQRKRGPLTPEYLRLDPGEHIVGIYGATANMVQRKIWNPGTAQLEWHYVVLKPAWRIVVTVRTRRADGTFGRKTLQGYPAATVLVGRGWMKKVGNVWTFKFGHTVIDRPDRPPPPTPPCPAGPGLGLLSVR